MSNQSNKNLNDFPPLLQNKTLPKVKCDLKQRLVQMCSPVLTGLLFDELQGHVVERHEDQADGQQHQVAGVQRVLVHVHGLHHLAHRDTDEKTVHVQWFGFKAVFIYTCSYCLIHIFIMTDKTLFSCDLLCLTFDIIYGIFLFLFHKTLIFYIYIQCYYNFFHTQYFFDFFCTISV